MTKTQPIPCTREEISKLIEVTREEPFYFMLFTVAKLTGRRLGELYGSQKKIETGRKVVGNKIEYDRNGNPVPLAKTIGIYKKVPNEWLGGVKVEEVDLDKGTMKVWVLKRGKLNMYTKEEEEFDTPVIAEQDLSDEYQIKFAISEFYATANNIDEENAQDYIHKLKARRNVILNMMQVYLAKFNNKVIIDDFRKEIEKAKKAAIKDGKLHKYPWYLNEMRVVGTFIGIRENISEKIADQLFADMLEEENSKGGET